MIGGAIAAALTPKPLLAARKIHLAPVTVLRRDDGSIRIIFPDQCYLQSLDMDSMKHLLSDQNICETLFSHGHQRHVDDAKLMLGIV